MKRTKLILGLAIGGFLFFVFGNFLIEDSVANTATIALDVYEESWDIEDPFIYTVETTYKTTDDNFNISGPGTYYHQVALAADTLYLFVWGTYIDFFTGGSMQLIKASTPLDTIWFIDAENGMSYYEIVFTVDQTAIYNFTIDCPDPVGGSSGFGGTGFYAIPQLTLGVELDIDYRYYANGAGGPEFAYYDFEAKSYTQRCSLQAKYFLWDDVSSGYRLLLWNNDDPSFACYNDVLAGDAEPTKITTPGMYIVYDTGQILAIEEYVDPEPDPLIPGFNIFIVMGTVIALTAILCRRKIREKRIED